MANSLQGKWQAVGRAGSAAGMDGPSGNVTATSRLRDRRAATMQRAKKIKMANNARCSKGTMLAQHTSDCTTPLPPAALLCCSSYLLPVAAAAAARWLAALFARSGQMPAAMAASPPLGHWCQVTDGKNCQPSGCASVSVCVCVRPYVCLCVHTIFRPQQGLISS